MRLLAGESDEDVFADDEAAAAAAAEEPQKAKEKRRVPKPRLPAAGGDHAAASPGTDADVAA